MTNLEVKVGAVEVILSLCILLGSGAGIWVSTKEDIVRLEERVTASENSNKASIGMLTDTHKDFTRSIDNLNQVLQELSISMAGVDARLGGVEEQLSIIRSKI